jgi:hypothetical protein
VIKSFPVPCLLQHLPKAALRAGDALHQVIELTQEITEGRHLLPGSTTLSCRLTGFSGTLAMLQRRLAQTLHARWGTLARAGATVHPAPPVGHGRRGTGHASMGLGAASRC